jgi:hypothetical protein
VEGTTLNSHTAVIELCTTNEYTGQCENYRGFKTSAFNIDS